MSWDDFYPQPKPPPDGDTAWAVLFFLAAVSLLIFAATHAHH